MHESARGKRDCAGYEPGASLTGNALVVGFQVLESPGTGVAKHVRRRW